MSEEKAVRMVGSDRPAVERLGAVLDKRSSSRPPAPSVEFSRAFAEHQCNVTNEQRRAVCAEFRAFVTGGNTQHTFAVLAAIGKFEARFEG